MHIQKPNNQCSQVYTEKKESSKKVSNNKTLFFPRQIKAVDGRLPPARYAIALDKYEEILRFFRLAKVNKVQWWLEPIEKVHQNRSHLPSQREFYELAPDNNR